MGETSLTYKGRKVTADAGDAPSLKIDGQTVPVRRNPDGTFWSPRFAFRNFATLQDLAQALIDHGPN